MTEQKSIKKNIIMNSLLTMSAFIFPLITFPYVSRILLPIGTGKVSFATSFISYFNMFAQLGIPTYGIRACAKVRDNREELTRTANELLVINLIFSFISYAFLAIALVFVPRLFEDRLLYIIVSITIVLNAIGMEWIFKALEQYTFITKRSVLFKFIAVIAMFALIHKQEDYVIYGGISIFAASASNIFNFLYVRKFIDMKWMSRYDLKKHMKPVLVFFAMACATTIYTHMDAVMLGFLATDEDVGFYNAAVKIKQILVSLVTSISAVLLPRASYYIEHGLTNEFERISKKALNFVFLAATPMMVFFVIFAKQGVFFLSGSAFSDSIIPMQIIMPTLLFIGITNILGIQMLVPLGKEKQVLWSAIFGAIANLIVNILLIPRYVSAGAAIGTLVAEFVVLIYQIFVLRKKVKEALLGIKYWKIVIALVLGVVSSIWVLYLQLDSFFTLLISGVLFFAVYSISLLILKESMMLEIWGMALGLIKRKNRSN